MPSVRRSLLRVAYSLTGAKQTTFGTPLANAALTGVINARAGTATHVQSVEKVEDLFDCTGQYKVGKTVLSRLGRLTLDIEADTGSMACFLAYLLGVAAAPTGGPVFAHVLSPLPFNVYQPPFTTLGVGFADGSDPGVRFYDVVAQSMVISGKDNDRVQARVELAGRGDLAALSGYTFPDCTPYTPLRMTDGAATLDGENILSGTDPNHTLRSFEFAYSNNLLVNDDPWPLASLDIARLERADIRTWGLRLAIEGRLNDTLHLKAKARTTVASTLRIGSATAGVTINIPSGAIEPGSPTQTFEGEAARGVLDLNHDPYRIPGNALTPLTVGVNNAQAGAYLVAA